MKTETNELGKQADFITDSLIEFDAVLEGLTENEKSELKARIKETKSVVEIFTIINDGAVSHKIAEHLDSLDEKGFASGAAIADYNIATAGALHAVNEEIRAEKKLSA